MVLKRKLGKDQVLVKFGTGKWQPCCWKQEKIWKGGPYRSMGVFDKVGKNHISFVN